MTDLVLQGELGLPLQNAEDVLLACGGFLTLMSAANQGEASARTILIESDEDEEQEASLPRCIIGYSPYAFTTDLQGTTSWVTGGPIEIRIEVETPEEYRSTKRQSLIWFVNALSVLWEEIKTIVTNGSGKLAVKCVRIGMFGRLDSKVYNNVQGFGAELIFEWRGI